MRFNMKNMFSKDKQKSWNCSEEKKPPGFISRVFCYWILRLFYHSYYKNLDECDLVPPKKVFDSKQLGDLFEQNWLKEETEASIAGQKGSLFRVIVKTFFSSFVPAMIMQFLYIFLRTTTPLLFGQLLHYWSPRSSMERSTALYYALGMVLGNLASAFFYNHGNFRCSQCALKIRVAISALVFRKILRMSKASLEETKAGKIVNILSNDLQRFELMLLCLNYIWILPLQVIGVCIVGYLQAGYSVMIGLAALLLVSLPLQGSFGAIIGTSRSKTARKTDDRVQLMNEVITGIQVIKMYAWEIPFKNLVQNKRDDELTALRNTIFMKTTIAGFFGFSERLSLFITILAFVLLGNPMSANVIYPLQQFMSSLQLGISVYLPLIVTSIAEIRITLNRLHDFLLLDDRHDLAPRGKVPSSSSSVFSHKTLRNTDKTVTPLSYHNTESLIANRFIRHNTLRRSLSFPNEVAVSVTDVSASWPGDSSDAVLKNISFQLRKGNLCAIIGAVGSGKSSLLQLLLSELPAFTGSLRVHGSISYASQDAWLYPRSVRENIIFGLPYDAQKYREICKACALVNDFQQFPHGDQSLVGERGVTLSGGQRARINLARAIYREADIYIFDDPLSAVDANVGRHLFDGCINGYLRGRTRVLVTHQIHFLQAADQIIVLNKGRVENIGSFDDLVASGKAFTMLLAALQENDKEDSSTLNGIKPETKPKGLIESSQTVLDPGEFTAQKIQQEERQQGDLSWEVVYAYFKYGGTVTCAATLFMVLVVAFCGALADLWVSYWSNQMANYEKDHGAEADSSLSLRVGQFTTGQYLAIQGCIVAALVVLTQLRVASYVSLCISASRNLHNLMFSTVITGIMRFFDTNLSGRVLNRFTKDIGELDESIPRTLWFVFQLYSSLLATLTINAIALYWTVLPSAFIIIIFYLYVKLYTKSAQDIKRLEGTSKSPVFGMITSSMDGIATIRAAGAQQRLINEFDVNQDTNTKAYNCYLGGVACLGLYLDILALAYLTCVVFIFLFIDKELIDVGNVGLVITQGYSLTLFLQHGALNLVELMAQLTSVERVLEYTRIDTEDHLFEGKVKPPLDWLAAGNIEFSKVHLRYGPGESPVLKDLNFVIRGGWKVGIVGRTGAGKSSLISALFRLAFIEGTIAIDGLDISLVSRQELRSKITIIPQTPVLFPATIRYNLDPFDVYSDDDLWRALEQVELKSAISSLDYQVTEGGSNFSVGQRQLMCLARAVLRSNRILVMDEATANVDPQTDHFIQQTIRRLFPSCTVLTIAHRLNTVMDADRVLVMGTGRVLEFDHPHILLSNPHSTLSAMVRESGNNIQLYNVAEQNYRKTNFEDVVV